MANELTDTGEGLALDFVNGRAPTAPTTPLKLALLTAQGGDATPGTEVTGGSYARQTIAFDVGGSNTAEILFNGMPACSVVGFEVFDSHATPKRIWNIPRTGGTATVNAGDTFRVAAGAIDTAIN